MGYSNTAAPLSRRIVALALLFAPTALRAAQPCAPPRVLFVCPAGTVKSAIARETLKRRAAEAGVPVRVQSRGVNPEDHVSPALAANLRADGLDPAAEPARRLAEADVAAADIVIAFDEAVREPALRGARTWDVPSWNGDYPAARAAQAKLVDTLVAELRARQAPACAGR
jgi:fructose-specific phosphotransferase system component IIB